MNFDVKSEKGCAILDTPHGSAIRWLMIQPKEQLTVMRIRKIIVSYAEKIGYRYR